MRRGVRTTEDAAEDAAEDVPVEVAEVVGVHLRDAEEVNIARHMEIMHTMVQIVKTRDPIIVHTQHSRIWWEDPRRIVIDMVGTNINILETIT